MFLFIGFESGGKSIHSFYKLPFFNEHETKMNRCFMIVRMGVGKQVIQLLNIVNEMRGVTLHAYHTGSKLNCLLD